MKIERAPVSLCLIVKNEPLLEQCLLSIRPYIKEIVVVDTGSTDNTYKTAKKYADICIKYTDCNDPETGLIENFAQARQKSFDLATQPWVGWLDADDLLFGCENLNKIINEYTEEAKQHTVGIMFPYEYGYDEFGVCSCRHYRERLISNKNEFHWVNPVHEVLINNNNTNYVFYTREEIIYKHQRQYGKKVQESGRNLRILRKYIERTGDKDARQLYYLGLECFNSGLFDEAAEHLIKYINESGWDDEKVMACLKLVDIFQMKTDYYSALTWAFKAALIKENWGECYFAIGKMFYFLAQNDPPGERRNWERCVHFIKIGLSLPPTNTLLFINPLDREYDIHRYYNMALNKLGNVKEALESVNIGLQKRPTDEGLLLNKRLYEIELAKQDITISVNKLKELGHIDQAALEFIVGVINQQLAVKDTSNIKETVLPEILEPPIVESSPKISDGKLDIIFFAGDGVEVWTPETVKEVGIGGSETMMLELSKRLASLGNGVRVYNSCNGKEGIYDGVTYYQTNKFKNLNCDVLVVSRRADMLDDQYNISAKLKLLWVHDVCAINARNDLLLKANKILALSKWHKQNMLNVHHVHPDHILVTRNGIDLERFNHKIERNRFKVVNSSSPDRSWPILLDCWGKIKEQVPQAELHLYYGFKNWEYSAQFDKGQADLIVRLKQQIKDMEPLGVVYHDRINQAELAKEFLSAGVWAHCTWFTETFCLTAAEAQAAGLRIITSSIAALNETVADRGILIDGDWTTEEYKNKFIEAVVSAMKYEGEEDRLLLQQYAKETFGLDELAKDWEKMFYGLIEEIKSNPIVPYLPTKPYRG